MTDEALPAFSPECVSLLLQDAERAGLKGATAITVALRNQLTLMKSSGAVPDQRTQTYYLAARVVRHGTSEPVEGVADVEGLAACNGVAKDLICAYFDDWDFSPADVHDNLVESQLKSARVNLSRKGEAHLQVMIEQGKSWVDLHVFTTEQRASDFAESIPTGKVF